jgi:hypothetical protein
MRILLSVQNLHVKWGGRQTLNSPRSSFSDCFFRGPPKALSKAYLWVLGRLLFGVLFHGENHLTQQFLEKQSDCCQQQKC